MAIVDILALLKMAYNFIFGVFEVRPYALIFWISVFALAGIVLIVLSIKLWLIERGKTKELKKIEAQLKSDRQKEKADRWNH